MTNAKSVYFEHYKAAEGLMDTAAEHADDQTAGHILQMAQVQATLAVAVAVTRVADQLDTTNLYIKTME